jgi:hypothetical protein
MGNNYRTQKQSGFWFYRTIVEHVVIEYRKQSVLL